MRLLLDTHVLIWALTSSHNLSLDARTAMLKPGAEVYVSVAALWEIALKHGRGGAGALPFGPQAALEMARQSHFKMLAILPEHVVVVGSLPDIHRDPFDRIMVAQALHEQMTFLTRDEMILKYDVQTLKA